MNESIWIVPCRLPMPQTFNSVRVSLFQFNMEDGYEKNVQLSLFGALTFSKTMTMDIKLDLPDIHDTWNTHILDLKPAKIYEVQ